MKGKNDKMHIINPKRSFFMRKKYPSFPHFEKNKKTYVFPTFQAITNTIIFLFK